MVHTYVLLNKRFIILIVVIVLSLTRLFFFAILVLQATIIAVSFLPISRVSLRHRELLSELDLIKTVLKFFFVFLSH